MNLDWKWIGLGVLIMLGLSLVAGFIVGMIVGAGVDPAAPTSLGGGQIALVMVLNFLSFLIGGFIVGLKSEGRTILEPGISAAVAVAVVLLLAGGLTLASLLAAGVVPFLAGLLGGWIGEHRQAAS